MFLFPQKFKLIRAASPDIFVVRRTVLLFVLTLLINLSSVGISFSQEEEEEEESDNQTAAAIAIFNKGQDAHEKNDLQAAVKFYDEAIKLAPELPEVEFQRGTALLVLGKLEDAEKSFRRAIELRPDWTLPMVSLGGLLVDKNKFPEAEKVLTKVVELDANGFPAYVALTELRLKTRAAPETLKELLKKLQSLTQKANPTAAVWAARGALEAALNDQNAAKKSLANALLIEPKNASALIGRAEISLAEGDYTRALDDAKMLLQTAPNSTNAKVLLARVYAENQNAAEALKILDALDASDPNVEALRNSIAASGSVNAADLEKQLETDAKNAAILGRLCTLLRTANPSKALDYCRRANAVEPTNVNHAVGFGAALVQSKQFDGAVAVLKQILQAAPDNYTARANLATALFELKRYAEAVTEYQSLTEKQPKLAIGFYFLAIAHDNLGEYIDAMVNYQQFLKIADPTGNKLEIEKVNLRLPTLQKQLKKSRNKK